MILTIAAKELKLLFASPLAWVVLGVLQAVLAWVFLGQLDAFLSLQPQLAQFLNPPGVTETVVGGLFGATAVALLTVTPILTMRLIAEERRNGTLPLLLSAPISLGAIVVGKFAGVWAFQCLVIVLSGIMAMSLLAGGPLDPGLVTGGLLGLALSAAGFCALGLYISCLTSHPALAAILGIGASIGFWLIDATAAENTTLGALSPLRHFFRLSQGLVDTADLAYFALFTVLFLALGVRRLDRERLP